MPLSPLFRRINGPAALSLSIAALLILAAAATAQTSPPAPRIEPAEGEYVATTRTNVRQQPSTQAQRIGRIEPGAKVRITGKVADAPWYAVVLEDGRTGFAAIEPLRSAAAQAPAQATTAPPAPAAQTDAAVREQLARIEAALAALAQRVPDTKELESLSASVKGLLEREERRNAAPATAAGEPKPESADEPTIAERIATIQQQIADQIREQRAEFGRLGERLDSVETSVQPLIDWAKGWSRMAAPAADSAQGWFWSTYAAARDWVASWIPWWPQAAPAAPAQQPPTG